VIDYIPKKLIKKEDLNLWQYDKILDKYPYVKRYLGNIFNEWIENLANPFETDWITALYKDELQFLELQKTTIEPTEIIRKINSVSAEISGYRYLKKRGYKNIEKIYEYGDWKYDNGIMSVKHKESIMNSYIYVENIIKGLAYIQENDIIRKYNSIFLKNSEGLGYKELKLLYEYLRKHLIENLIESDKILIDYPDYYRKELNFSYNNYNAKLYINSRTAHIQIYISLNKEKSIELEFNSEKPPNIPDISTIMSILTDKNAYFRGEKREIKLYKYITEIIKKECNKKRKPNILWICIDLSPIDAEKINDKCEQIKFLEIINKDHCIKTVLSFNVYPSFGKAITILESQ
jgi:hypothetical protein